jgi:hypothetical protein
MKAGKRRRVKRTRKPRKVRRNKSRLKVPRTARQYFAMSKEDRETWDSVGHVVSRIRSGRISLPKASKEFGIEPSVVTRLGRSALRRQKNGRYVAKKADRLLRVLSILDRDGRREVAVRDSRQASLLGSYWAAVQRYLQTGDDSALREFQGKKIVDASRKRHALLTDLDQLDRLGSAGVLSFESLYGGVR